MKQKYSLKGIEKIIERAGKESLAKYYGVDINADFEEIITKDFRENNIPNGSEVALYFSLTPEEYNKIVTEGNGGALNPQEAASEVFKADSPKRAMFGFDYMITNPEYGNNGFMTSGRWGSVIYFFVDEPIIIENIGRPRYAPRYIVGGTSYNELFMGTGYYESHKDELEATRPDKSKIKAVDKYVEYFMQEFENVEGLGGYGPRGEYEETDGIRAEKAKAEKMILELTGKESIDELSLRDFISLKRRLEKEAQELEQQFVEKFTKKDEERE